MASESPTKVTFPSSTDDISYPRSYISLFNTDSRPKWQGAIVERLKEHYRIGWLEEDDDSYPIRVTIMKDIVTIALDKSGDSLHKRGYRPAAGKAPLSETLAAALIMLTPWRGDRILVIHS